MKEFIAVLLFVWCTGCASTIPTTTTGGLVISQGQATTYVIGQTQGTATLLLNPSNGAPDLAFSLLRLVPGAAVPPHSHIGSSESLYLLSGEVKMAIGGRTFFARKGDTVYIPLGVEHAAEVISTEDVVAIQVYVQPGPQERFRKGRIYNRDGQVPQR